MAKSQNAEILDFLALPENLPLTLEIATYATKVRENLYTRFWQDLRREISATRPIERDEHDFVYDSLIGGKYVGIRAIPRKATKQRENLAITIEHLSEPKMHVIYIGPRWNSPIKPNDGIYQKPPIKKLKERLISLKYEPWKDWWLCAKDILWYDSPDTNNPDAFLNAYVEDPKPILSQIATAFWDLVTDTESEVAEINKLVADI